MTTTFRAIMVPLDGSPLAEQALSVGASLARRTGAALHLVSARTSPEADGDMPSYLASIANAVEVEQGLPARVAVLHGAAADVLLEYARSAPIDLIVLTTHGRGGLKRWWLGSVADQLLRRSGTPLLLLHPCEFPQPTTFGRILVGLDGESDERILERAVAFGALSSPVRFILAAVVEPEIPLLTPLALYPHHLGPTWSEQRLAEAEGRLVHHADRLRLRGLDVSTKVVEGRGVADSLVELGRALSAECLVVGTHGLEGIERMVLGSVAAKTLRGAEVPVLVVPMARPGPEGLAAGGAPAGASCAIPA